MRKSGRGQIIGANLVTWLTYPIKRCIACNLQLQEYPAKIHTQTTSIGGVSNRGRPCPLASHSRTHASPDPSKSPQQVHGLIDVKQQLTAH